MKKLSIKQRLRHIRRARRQHRKRRILAGMTSSEAAWAKYMLTQQSLPETIWRKADKTKGEAKGYIYFDAPEVFSFSENYAPTLAYLMEFRKSFFFSARNPNRGKRKLYANFSTIKEIEPAAGLALAAEIYRWSKWVHRRPNLHGHKWQRNVRDFFVHAGLFELLNVQPPEEYQIIGTPQAEDLRVLKYRTGSLTTGQTVAEIKHDLEEKSGVKITVKHLMYQALCEAMNNVKHHAYKPELTGSMWPTVSICKNWWTYGVWFPSERKIKLVFLDQGVGIPQTLPYTASGRSILNKIKDLFVSSDPTDADCIEAAMVYGKTSTGKKGRGKGLWQMGEWIDQTNAGYFRILSGTGMITKSPGESIVKQKLAAPFMGTLVEWELKL